MSMEISPNPVYKSSIKTDDWSIYLWTYTVLNSWSIGKIKPHCLESPLFPQWETLFFKSIGKIKSVCIESPPFPQCETSFLKRSSSVIKTRFSKFPLSLSPLIRFDNRTSMLLREKCSHTYDLCWYFLDFYFYALMSYDYHG